MLPYFPFSDAFNPRIGTTLLGHQPLLEVDALYEPEVQCKRQLLTEHPDYYFLTLPGHEPAQWEVLELVLSQLAQYYPADFSLTRTPDTWYWQNHRLAETHTFRPGDPASLPQAPLDWVGRQVQEDLILLTGEGPTLVAGQLCFGNVWALDEKLGLPFWDIHGPVTHIVTPMMHAAQTVMQRLPAGKPVSRINWSIKVREQLDMTTRRMPDYDQYLRNLLPHLTPDTIGQHAFIRIERQTLTRLPGSGAILFGIHTYNNRLDHELRQRPGAARNLLNVLTTAPPALLDYKGIGPFLPPLLACLTQHATPPRP